MSREISVQELRKRAEAKAPPVANRAAYIRWRRARLALGLPTRQRPLVTPEERREYMRKYMQKRRRKEAGK